MQWAILSIKSDILQTSFRWISSKRKRRQNGYSFNGGEMGPQRFEKLTGSLSTHKLANSVSNLSTIFGCDVTITLS